MDQTQDRTTSIDTPLAAAWREWIDAPANTDDRVERMQLALDGDVPPSQLLMHRDRSTSGTEAAA